MFHRILFLFALAVCAPGCFTDSSSPVDGTDAGTTEADTGSTDAGTTGGELDMGVDDTGSDTGTDTGTDGTTGGELPDPVAWYRFDGGLFDASGNNYDAQDPLGGASFEDAMEGMGVRLAGGTYLAVPGAGDLGTGSVTVVARVRRDLDTTQDAVFAFGDGSSEDPSENMTLMHFFEGRAWLLTETGPGDNHSHDLAPSPGVGEWVTVAWVLDGSDARYFEDGQELGALPYVAADSVPADAFIGGGPAQQTFDGLLDELAVYDVALTDPRLPD